LTIDFIIFRLDNEQAKGLRKDVEGSGGFQSLLREFQSQLQSVDRGEWVLRMTGSQLDRAGKYLLDYGAPGGFQGRLSPFIMDIAKLAHQQQQKVRETTTFDQFPKE
jgi:hypothetical protein